MALLMLIEHFSIALMVETPWTDIVEIVVFEGVGNIKCKFQGEWGVAHQRLLASEN